MTSVGSTQAVYVTYLAILQAMSSETRTQTKFNRCRHRRSWRQQARRKKIRTHPLLASEPGYSTCPRENNVYCQCKASQSSKLGGLMRIKTLEAPKRLIRDYFAPLWMSEPPKFWIKIYWSVTSSQMSQVRRVRFLWFGMKRKFYGRARG